MTITPEDLQALIRDYSIEITPKAAQKSATSARG